jgi:hypothetical protein
MRVAVGVWVGEGRKRSLLVEYERPTTLGGMGIFRLPGEFVEADRKVHEHAERVLERLHLWDEKAPESYEWSNPSSEGITTLSVHRLVDSYELNSRLERDARCLLLPRSSWPHILKHHFGGLKPFVQRMEGKAKKPRFTVADDVLEAILCAPA